MEGAWKLLDPILSKVFNTPIGSEWIKGAQSNLQILEWVWSGRQGVRGF